MMKLNIQLFASGTIQFNTSNGLTGKIDWSSTSNGSDQNSSTVVADIYARRTSGSTYGSSWRTTISIDNDSSTRSTWDGSPTVSTSWRKMYSFSKTVPHNPDGTKTINISGSIKGPTGTSLGNTTVSGSADVSLDFIPRATECPRIYATINNLFSTTMSPASNTFTHILYYKDPNGTSHEIWNGYNNISFTLSGTTFYPYMATNEREKNFDIQLDTYSNGAIIGSKFSTMTVYTRESDCKPLLNSVSFYDTNDETFALTNNRSHIIANKSTPQVTLNVTYRPTENPSLPSYVQWQEFYGIGETFELIDGNILWGNTTNVFDVSSTYTKGKSEPSYNFIVYDSRSYYYSDNIQYKPVKFIKYFEPIIKNISYTKPNQYSETMLLSLSSEYWSGNFGTTSNTLSISYRVRENNGEYSEWQGLTFTPTSLGNDISEISISNLVIDNPLDENGDWNYLSSYSIDVKLNDKLSTVSVLRSVSSTLPIYDWYQTESGERYFNVNGNLLVNNEPINTGGNSGGNGNSMNIVDVTESQNGRYITSKIPFNDSRVLFFIFQAVSAWSSENCQTSIINPYTYSLPIWGNWSSSTNTFAYCTIFERVGDNQFRVQKYAQDNNTTSNNYTLATDSSWGAIRPNAIYAVMKDGAQFDPTNLIAETTLAQNSSTMNLENLNLGFGVYKIIICEYSTVSSTSGHYVLLNNISNNYNLTLNVSDTNGWTRDANPTSGIAIVNGWNRLTNLFYAEITLFFYNRDWINAQSTTNTNDVMILQHGKCNSKIDKITSISVVPKDSDSIGNGSYIKVYRM